jgi:hypothetical protein
MASAMAASAVGSLEAGGSLDHTLGFRMQGTGPTRQGLGPGAWGLT